MTETVTFDDLRALLVEAAGSTDEGDLGPDAIDTDLYDLGYDSLALMELAARIKEEYAVEILDEEVTDLRSFRRLLDRVNGSASPAEAH
jgi:acyl carrier protein